MLLAPHRVVLPELGRTRCILLDFRLSSPLLPRLPRPTVNTCISLTQAWPGLSHVTSALPRRRVSTWQSCAFPPFSLCFGLCLKPLPFLRRLQAPCHSSSPPSFLLPLSFPVFQPLRFYSLPPFSFVLLFPPFFVFIYRNKFASRKSFSPRSALCFNRSKCPPSPTGPQPSLFPAFYSSPAILCDFFLLYSPR